MPEELGVAIMTTSTTGDDGKLEDRKMGEGMTLAQILGAKCETETHATTHESTSR